MIQVSKFLPPNYETNYNKLTGPTGPLVYPALHVYIHSALYYITNNGVNIKLAQIIYAGLYLCTLALVLACYRRVGAPPWLLIPLVLSKRLHSIFLLRLFNDCWASFFLWLSIYGGVSRRWYLLVVAWTLGVGVKMTMLLPLPALAPVIMQAVGMEKAFLWGCFSWILTFGMAAPFMSNNEPFIYLAQAFDLGRVFMYKWTVNWKFIPEDLFLSKQFAYTLLALHVATLLLFLHRRWVQPSSSGYINFVTKYFDYMSIEDAEQAEISRRMTPHFVMSTLLGSSVIGFLFARSLHYQFFAYIAWATPYLLWSAGHHPLIVLGGCALQEFAWLVYPSTAWSSAIVVFMLAFQVDAAWTSLPDFYPPTILTVPEKKEK